MGERTVVLLGELAKEAGPVVDVVRRAGLTPVGIKNIEKGKIALRRDGVVCALFSSELESFEELCVDVRSELTAGDIPLIAFVPDPWSSPLERLFMHSVDDYIAADNPASLEPKLLALARGNPWVNLNPQSGRVVVADEDRSRRVLYGRMLRRKGLGVDFAIDKEDLLKNVSKSWDTRLAIADANLPPAGVLSVIQAFNDDERTAQIPWIVTGDVDDLEGLGEDGLHDAIRLFQNDDPPESLLFLINDLLVPPPANVRKSPRVLFGGPTSFRVTDSRHIIPAFTYNINRTGVFIRTLVPPPVDSEIQVDIRPPFGEGRVRVYGKVVWRKECGQDGGPVVPTGMGVIWTNLPLADGAALDAGYEALLDSIAGHGTKPTES